MSTPRRERLVDYLPREQLPDGGQRVGRLRDYADAHGPRRAEVPDAEARGREFLLARRLYRSHRTGAVVHPALLRRW